MNNDITIDFASARPNQKTTLNFEDNQLRVELNQANSTPGVLFGNTLLDIGAYQLHLSCESSAHNVFGIVFFSEDMAEKKIRISKKMPMGSSDMTLPFQVTESGYYVPAVLASLGKDGDYILLKDFRLTCDIPQQSQDLSKINESTITEVEEDVVLTDFQPTEQTKEDAIVDNQHEETQGSIKEEPYFDTQRTSLLYFFVGEQKFGIGSFARELAKLIPTKTFTDISQAEDEVLKQGKILCVNGFVKKTEDLALKYPQQIYCFWHSSLKGVEMMGEMQRYFNFVSAINKKLVMGYFLNENEFLPIGAKRFWLPFQLQEKSFSNCAKFDFALPLASPHSLACKDIFETICVLLQNNYSFIMPKWYGDIYNVDALKVAFNSDSNIGLFETNTYPIEVAYFQSAKIYLSLSITDTMPYGCVEAINSGVPTLMSTNVGWAKAFREIKGFNPIISDINTLSALYEKIRQDKVGLKYLYEQQYAIFNQIADKNNRQMLKAFFEEAKEEIFEFDMYSVQDPTSCLFLIEQLKQNKYIKLHEIKMLQSEQGLGVRLVFGVLAVKRDGYLGLGNIKWFVDAYETLFQNAKNYENITWEILQATYTLINIYSEIAERGKLTPNMDLKNAILLGIDRLGWAFDNISKQVVKAGVGQGLTILKMEYFFILLLTKVFDLESNIVCFWWRAKNLLEVESPRSKFITMLYDHYSWQNAKEELVGVCQTSCAIGVANPMLRQELKSLGISKPIFVVKDGVDFDIFPLKKPKDVSEGITTQPFTFGWIGNANIQKSAGFGGSDFKGFSLIQEAVAQTSFALEYYDVSTNKPMPHTEVFDKFYSKIDCYVCASESEGTPNTVFEALACGIPVITTDVGNVGDVVIEGFNGKIIERSPNAIQNAMEEIAANGNFYRQNSNNIRESVRSFEWGVKILDWLQLLRYAISQK